MSSVVIGIGELKKKLHKIPIGEEDAVRRGVERTLRIDATRWVQWAIRGGGFGGTSPKTPKRPKAPKGKSKRARLRKTLKKLGDQVGPNRRRGKKPGGKRPTSPKPDPCPPSEAPAYRTPIDTGDYAREWGWEMQENGGVYFSLASPRVKASVIELGRRPGPIPVRPLAEWVRRKLGCSDPAKALGIAIAITKTASRQRRHGLKVLKRAYPMIAASAIENVERELARTARESK